MLKALEPTGRDSAGTKATAALSKGAVGPAEMPAEQDDGLAAAAGPIIMAAYAVVLTVAVLAFRVDGEALLMVAISIGFAIMYFGVPLAMMRVRARHDARWRQGEARQNGGTVATFTGRIRRTEAVVQMVIVPVMVSVAFTLLAVIRALVWQ